MCKIIEFKPRESNGYLNLKALFDICDNIESCNFYLESVEELYNSGHITEKEMYTLRRIGRQKRISLANTKPEPIKAEEPGTYLYTPEMGQEKPEECEMVAGLCYYGNHYWIRTPLELKGRGITKDEQSRDGLNNYTVTKLAYSKLEKQYKIAYESNLD